MPKFMNSHYGYSRIFMDADKGGGAGSSDDNTGGGDDQDDDTSDEDGEDKPKYTQADLDKYVDRAVARTIAKERRRAEREKDESGDKGPDNGGKSEGAEDSEDKKARRAAEKKSQSLEMKLACYEAGVTKDAVNDVTALAQAYMEADEELDLEDAIDKVVKKYPQFVNGTDDSKDKNNSSWGMRQSGKGDNRQTGVEAAFYARNPNLKP